MWIKTKVISHFTTTKWAHLKKPTPECVDGEQTRSYVGRTSSVEGQGRWMCVATCKHCVKRHLTIWEVSKIHPKLIHFKNGSATGPVDELVRVILRSQGCKFDAQSGHIPVWKPLLKKQQVQRLLAALAGVAPLASSRAPEVCRLGSRSGHGPGVWAPWLEAVQEAAHWSSALTSHIHLPLSPPPSS